MTRIAILTDSTAGLTPEMLHEYHITSVPLTIVFGEETFEDQISISSSQFMDRLQHTTDLPHIIHPSPEHFEQIYRDLAQNHDAIIAVLNSSKLSGTVKSAITARDAVAPAIRVSVIDSLNVSLGLGFQAIRAATLAARGIDIDEITRRLHIETNSYHTAFFVDTWEYLERGGLVGRSVSIIGSLIHLKPILRVDEGQVVPYERIRTRSRAIAELRAFVRAFPTFAKLAVLYTSDKEDAEQFATELNELTAIDQISIGQIGPMLASHLGPGALGVSLFEGETA